MTDDLFESVVSQYGHRDDQSEYLRGIHTRNQSKFERLERENARIDRMLDVLTEFVEKVAKKRRCSPC